MPHTRAHELASRFATEYAHRAALLDPHNATRLAAFWCLSFLGMEPGSCHAREPLEMLSAHLRRPATGADVVAILEEDGPVPAAVAELVFATYGSGALVRDMA